MFLIREDEKRLFFEEQRCMQWAVKGVNVFIMQTGQNRSERFDPVIGFEICCFRILVRKGNTGMCCIFKEATVFGSSLAVLVCCVTERVV